MGEREKRDKILGIEITVLAKGEMGVSVITDDAVCSGHALSKH